MFRPQWSILSLLWLTTLIACGITLYNVLPWTVLAGVAWDLRTFAVGCYYGGF